MNKKSNRIVVDYGGEEKVVFLSVVLNEAFSSWKPTDESELHWTTACSIFAGNEIKKSDIVKTELYFNFSDELYKSLKEKNETNKEGFVVRFYPSNFRVKIKFEEYVRLHRIMTNLSTTAIWEVLSNGGDILSTLTDVPDEFYDKIHQYSKELMDKYASLENEYHFIFKILGRSDDFEFRAGFAERAKRYKYPAILFKMYDDKDYSGLIWKIIKPEFEKL